MSAEPSWLRPPGAPQRGALARLRQALHYALRPRQAVQVLARLPLTYRLVGGALARYRRLAPRNRRVLAARPIKVLLVPGEMYVGGNERTVLNLARALPRHGYEVVIACSVFDWLAEDSEQLAGIKLVRVQEGVFQHFDLTSVPAFRRLMRAEGVGIVHLLHPHAAFPAAYAAAWERVPLILRGLPGLDPARTDWEIARDRLLAGLVDATCPLCEDHCRQVRAEGFERIYPLIMGIDPPEGLPTAAERAARRSQMGLPAEAPVVGIVGRLHEVKGHDTFLRAAAQVLAAAPETHFALVGDGHRRGALEGLAAELGIAERVHFVGEWKEWSIFPALAAFDIGVVASTNEGFCQVLLEYMAMGLPVVSTDVGAARELLAEEAGVVVPRGDAAALAAAVGELLADPERRAELGRRGQERMLGGYTVEHMAAAFARCYEEHLRSQT